MADIGSLLRETRIRKKIDITTVEEATKIRAKYLRALENEEWVVLPGPDLRQDVPAHVCRSSWDSIRACWSRSTARASRSPRTSSCRRSRRGGACRTRASRVPPPSRGRRRARGRGGVPRLPARARSDRRRRQRRRQGASSHRLGHAVARRSRSAAHRADAPPARRSVRTKRNVRLEVVAARNVWVCLVDAQRNAASGRGGSWRRGTARGRSGRRPSRSRSETAAETCVIDGKRRDTPERSEPLGYIDAAVRDQGAAREQRPTCG